MGREAGEEGLSGKFRCLVGLCTRMNGQTPDFGGHSLILLIVVDFIGCCTADSQADEDRNQLNNN